MVSRLRTAKLIAGSKSTPSSNPSVKPSSSKRIEEAKVPPQLPFATLKHELTPEKSLSPKHKDRAI